MADMGTEHSAVYHKGVPKKSFRSRLGKTWNHIKRDRQLLLLFLPCILFYVIFRYGPLYGLIIAFKDYSVFTGVLGSEWVGFEHFITFFTNQDFWLLFRNTLLLGLYTLIFGFPFPIMLALLLNEVRTKWFKKSVQTFSYLPAFLSVVIISSMIIDFLSPNHGILNQMLAAFGFEKNIFSLTRVGSVRSMSFRKYGRTQDTNRSFIWRRSRESVLRSMKRLKWTVPVVSI